MAASGSELSVKRSSFARQGTDLGGSQMPSVDLDDRLGELDPCDGQLGQRLERPQLRVGILRFR